MDAFPVSGGRVGNFETALAFVLSWEGGNVDDPLDKGGRTSRGVTQRTYDGWRVDHKLEKRDVWLMEHPELVDIYKSMYWWPAKDADWPLSLVVFDSAVLFGVGRASEWLTAVNWMDTDAPTKAFAILCLRRERHRANIAKDKTQGRFWGGWLNRINALAKMIKSS